MLRAPTALLCAAATLAAGGAALAGGGGMAGGPHAGASARPLPFFYDLYTFRGEGGGTTVVAAFAVRAGELEEERAESTARYRFDVTLVLADTALRSVTRTEDSVFLRVPDPLDDRHLISTQVQVDAAPSGTTVQRVVMTDASAPGIGQLYTTPFPIPDYGGSALMLSDVALGLPGVGGGWSRADTTIALLPTSQFPESSFDVYYEIYNLPRGRAYHTEVSVESLDGEGRKPVRLDFTDVSRSEREGVTPELRRIDASLPGGRYRLTVSVIDEVEDRIATRSRTFHVRGWGRGTTMVPALPRGARGSRVATPAAPGGAPRE